MNDFTAGYMTAIRAEIEHWNARLWDTALEHDAARAWWEAGGEEQPFERSDIARQSWMWAHFELAQIKRLTAGLLT